MMAKLDKTDLILKKKIAERIRQLREEKEGKQSAFAKQTLRDRQTISRWETGRGASIYTINKLCKEFNLSLKDFFDSETFK
ncbi:MAG: helix-turn-helix transcriptional regulator [Agriterribacter sp.]